MIAMPTCPLCSASPGCRLDGVLRRCDECGAVYRIIVVEAPLRGGIGRYGLTVETAPETPLGHPGASVMGPSGGRGQAAGFAIHIAPFFHTFSQEV